MHDDYVIKDALSGWFWAEDGWYPSPLEAKIFRHPQDAVDIARAVKQYEIKGVVEVVQLASESGSVTVWAA